MCVTHKLLQFTRANILTCRKSYRYQEYVLSKEVIFRCGPDTLNSELFRRAICTWEQFNSDQAKKRPRPTIDFKHVYIDYILKSSNRFRRFNSHRFLHRAEEDRNARKRGYDLIDLYLPHKTSGVYRSQRQNIRSPRTGPVGRYFSLSELR